MMKFKLLFLFSLIISIYVVRGDLNFDDDEEEDVSFKAPFLTDENFEEEIQNTVPLMLYFHAPWCNHCKKMTPQYNKAAEILLNEDKIKLV